MQAMEEYGEDKADGEEHRKGEGYEEFQDSREPLPRSAYVVRDLEERGWRRQVSCVTDVPQISPTVSHHKQGRDPHFWKGILETS